MELYFKLKKTYIMYSIQNMKKVLEIEANLLFIIKN